MSVRVSGRGPREMRPLRITTSVNRHAEGSCLIHVGETQVLCTASVDTRVPGWLVGRNEGWVTAEYGMLPRATGSRVHRDRAGGRPSGRTFEIQRLIGRALRAVVDRKVFGERTVTVDCDVLQADGGTRCASIVGGFVAMAQAFAWIGRAGKLVGYPILDQIAAVSCGVVAGEVLLDLEYEEDSAAEVDLNVAKTGDGRYVEIQGTAEERAFPRETLDQMLDAADVGLDVSLAAQREALGESLAKVLRPRRS